MSTIRNTSTFAAVTLAALWTAACDRQAETLPDFGPTPAAKSAATASPAESAADPSGANKINPRLLRRFQPLPAFIGKAEPDPTQVALGRMLYFDVRLSKDRAVSCNSCHPVGRFGMDNQATSRGIKGQKGTRNSPTVFHAAGHVAQFWDGRAADVEQQALGPIVNPGEMGMSSTKAVVAVLKSIPEYVRAFSRAFPGDANALNAENLGRAIGAFERKLVAPARWDHFLAGDAKALSEPEIEGFKIFADVGCVQCHTGAYLGGSMFQEVGVARPWPHQDDPGRFGVTGQAIDRMRFKVPSLRNVAMTGPYFHDGSVADLGQAVAMMGEYQLGIHLTDNEVSSIKTWLGSLTGEPPGDLLPPPALPPDGPTTASIAR